MTNDALLQESPYITKAATITNAYNMTEWEKYFEFQLPDGEDLGHEPGQFVMVMVHGVGDAPISVASSSTKKGKFDLVVRNAGAVTGALHKMEAGAVVGIRGPFGRGFPHEMMKGKDLVMVGGGCGNIPLHSLINFVMDNRGDFKKLDILIGCKNPNMRLFKEEIEAWKQRDDVNLLETVDHAESSAWNGNVGLITTLIPPLDINPENTVAVVVGPPVMYKFVIAELVKKNIPDDQIVVSLERHMKCGVGKCGHCQIGDTYCCQDGPVFTYNEVKDNIEAL